MKFEVGEIVKGKITGITKFGAFVECEEGRVGLVHISEISNTYVKNISDYIKEGQEVKVKILNIEENGKLGLSIKRAEENKVSKNDSDSKHFEHNNSVNEKRSVFSISNKPNFEDMISKFKKLSDEKIADFREKTKYRKGKSPHKNGNM